MSMSLELLTENPSQWKSIVSVTPGIAKKEIKPFVILALKELEGKPDSRISQIISTDKYAAIRSVVRHVARQHSATKEPWRQVDVVNFLEGLRFSPECVAEFSSLLCMEKMYENIPKHLCVRPGLASLKWRIDASLWQSNSVQPDMDPEKSKALILNQTYVILVFTLTNNEILSYRISISKFHELRFSVANALKNMIVLEKRKCMRKD